MNIRLRHLIPAAIVGAALTFAAPAFAHVTAQPPQQTAGGYDVVTFQMPNERSVPSTKLDIQIPPSVQSVDYKPVYGWKVKAVTSKLATPYKDSHGNEVTSYTSELIYTGSLPVGAFEQFPVSMKLPDKGDMGDELFFPALQTYANGEVVHWTQKPTSPSQNMMATLTTPSPTVHLVPAASTSSSATSSKSSSKSSSSSVKDTSARDSASTAKLLGIIGIIVGALGLIFGFIGLTRKKR